MMPFTFILFFLVGFGYGNHLFFKKNKTAAIQGNVFRLNQDLPGNRVRLGGEEIPYVKSRFKSFPTKELQKTGNFLPF